MLDGTVDGDSAADSMERDHRQWRRVALLTTRVADGMIDGMADGAAESPEDRVASCRSQVTVEEMAAPPTTRPAEQLTEQPTAQPMAGPFGVMMVGLAVQSTWPLTARVTAQRGGDSQAGCTEDVPADGVVNAAGQTVRFGSWRYRSAQLSSKC